MESIQFIPCDYGGFATGTSRQGYIENVTTNQLIEMFGDPICYAPDEMGGKVTMEWIIETQKTMEDGGTEYGVFTLYDWKGSRPWQNDHEWTVNIGGKSIDDYWNALMHSRYLKKQISDIHKIRHVWHMLFYII